MNGTLDSTRCMVINSYMYMDMDYPFPGKDLLINTDLPAMPIRLFMDGKDLTLEILHRNGKIITCTVSHEDFVNDGGLQISGISIEYDWNAYSGRSIRVIGDEEYIVDFVDETEDETH